MIQHQANLLFEHSNLPCFPDHCNGCWEESPGTGSGSHDGHGAVHHCDGRW